MLIGVTYSLVASLLDQEFHGDQWTALDPGLQISLATELLMNRSHDLAASRLLHARPSPLKGAERALSCLTLGGPDSGAGVHRP